MLKQVQVQEYFIVLNFSLQLNCSDRLYLIKLPLVEAFKTTHNFDVLCCLKPF